MDTKDAEIMQSKYDSDEVEFGKEMKLLKRVQTMNQKRGRMDSGNHSIFKSNNQKKALKCQTQRTSNDQTNPDSQAEIQLKKYRKSAYKDLIFPRMNPDADENTKQFIQMLQKAHNIEPAEV